MITRRRLMQTTLRRLTLSLALAIAGSAAAEPAPTNVDRHGTSYTFDDDLVSGAAYDLKGELLTVRKRADRHSLVDVRSSLVRELLLSVEDI
jgi:hypothetical protein